MAVVLPDRDLTVAVSAHPWPRDARGMPMPPKEEDREVRGPYPGAAQENPDNTWSLRVDDRCWPMRAGDTITDGDKVWVATGTPKLHMLPGGSGVDFIECQATLEPPRVP